MPMKNINPFSYGKPIDNLERFVGRQDGIEQVFSRLLSAFESTSIVGERRMGKTSILKVIAHPDTVASFDLDPDKYIFIYQDFQFLDAETVPTRFWQRVLQAIQREIKEHKAVCDEIDVARKAETIDNFTLDDIFSLIDDESMFIVLLLDEFENVTRNEHFDSDFFGGLRALAIHHNLALITSSRRDLVELTHSDSVRSSPFFNIFATIHLRPFTETEATDLIEQYLAESGVRFLLSELNVIFAIAGSHPYFLQVAGHHLFAAHQQGLDDEARRRYLVEKTRSEVEPIFRDYWQNSTAAQHTLLAVMSLRELERNGGEDTIEDLERFYVRAEQIIHDVERRCLVVKNPANSAYHLFSTELREWIADEIVGEVDDLRAWQKWQADEKTLVGVLPSMLQDKLAQVVHGLNPTYRKSLGGWLLEPHTADTAMELLANFQGHYEQYRAARPERDAAASMAVAEAPIGDTPKGLFEVVSKRLEAREKAKEPAGNLDQEIAALDEQHRKQQIRSLKQRILQHADNLNEYLEQAATYGGPTNAPIKLKNDIKEQESIINELEAELARLEQTDSTT
jgi:uncharacterized protein